MTIKQLGGVFGRNPTFNDVTIEGELTFDGDIDVNSDLKVDGDLEVTGTILVNNSIPQAKIDVRTDPGDYAVRLENGLGTYFRVADGGITEVGNNVKFLNAGSGIDFSATSGTGTSELFDDYEEGTWTPTLTFASAGDLSIAYSNRIGNYVKIGRVVVLTCRVTASSFTHSTSSGALRITGIPFTPASNHYSSVLFNGINKAGYTAMSAQASAGSSVILFYASAMGTGQSGVTAPNVPSGGAPFIQFTLCYETDS